MAINYPVKLTFSSDKNSLKKAEKDVKKATGGDEKKGKDGTGRAAAVGGAIGGVIGSLIGSLDAIQGLLQVIGAILNAFVAPFIPVLLTLIKPAMGLFLLVGTLLLKWLRKIMGAGTAEKVGTGVGAAVGGVAGAIVGGPIGAVIGAVIGAAAVQFGALLGDALAKGVWWISGKLADFAEWMGGVLAKAITFIDDVFGTDLTGIFIAIGDYFKGLWLLLSGIVTLDWDRIKEGLATIGTALYDMITSYLMSALAILETFGTWIWEYLVEQFTTSLEILADFGTWIWNSMVSILTTSLQVLSGIGDWIKNKIQDLWSGIKSAGSGLIETGKSVLGISDTVNDGIITPSGKVIRTNPRDYVAAARNPEDLGGRGNKRVEINLNLSGAVIGNIESFKNEIKREIAAALGMRGGF